MSKSQNWNFPYFSLFIINFQYNFLNVLEVDIENWIEHGPTQTIYKISMEEWSPNLYFP